MTFKTSDFSENVAQKPESIRNKYGEQSGQSGVEPGERIFIFIWSYDHITQLNRREYAMRQRVCRSRIKNSGYTLFLGYCFVKRL